jgi:hypothetical protein
MLSRASEVYNRGILVHTPFFIRLAGGSIWPKGYVDTSTMYLVLVNEDPILMAWLIYYS